ncbi:MAG: nuclear transport factor 2 family protein [Treponema sp.]|nr:nuclear transport factor 2 family protein [Treponema sp.]
MKKLTLIFALLASLIFVSPLFCESKGMQMNENDESQIKSLYRKMYDAMIAKDMVEMEKIHDTSFVLIHMTGSRMNKREYMAAVKDGTLNYYSAEHDDISASVNGSKASLCGKSKVNAAVYGGGKHTWRLQQDMTAEKINGEWKFTHSQASTY